MEVRDEPGAGNKRRRNLRSVREKTMHYESVLKRRSESFPEISYTVRKISFGGRLELAKDIRELSRRMEFAAAGQEASDEMDASILAAEIERLYVRWGLVSLEGLAVDGG